MSAVPHHSCRQKPPDAGRNGARFPDDLSGQWLLIKSGIKQGVEDQAAVRKTAGGLAADCNRSRHPDEFNDIAASTELRSAALILAPNQCSRF